MAGCLDCGRTLRGRGSRCKACDAQTPNARNRALRSTRAWRDFAAARVREWVAEHGWLCPGWGRDPHGVEPGSLTCDHPVALAAGGELLPDAAAVLCRSCNSRKGARSAVG